MAETVKANWEQAGGLSGNSVLDGGDFYISYAPSPGMGLAMWAADDGGSETALVKDGKFFILNGDWREQYEAALPNGFDACLAVFNEHKAEHLSSWSEA